MTTYDYINFSCTLSSEYGTPGLYANLTACENAVNDGSVRPVLILNPLWSASKKTSLPLLINKLGDGYQQIVFQGVDFINEEWHEEWSITSPVLIGTKVDGLLNQLRFLCITSFLWSPNNGVIDYQEFTCDGWQKTRLGVNQYQITTNFKKIRDRKNEFLNLLISSYIIVCPPLSGFKLAASVDSDAKKFNWQQIAGNKTVLFDNNTIKEPTIFIQSTCYTTGCDDGTGLPIILRVSLASNPNRYQDIIVYNTLTSTNFGNSVSQGVLSDRVCQKVTFFPAPLYPQKAYCGEEGTSIFVHWNPPSCESQFVIGYSLVVNTTGSYIEVDYVDVSEERTFFLEFNKHYKIVTVFSFYGKIVRTPSDIIYLSTSETQHFLFGDDSFSSGLSIGKLTDSYSKVNLKVTTYEYNDIYNSLLSISKLTQSYSKTDLKVTSYEYQDNYTSQISISKLNSSYAKINLGGVVIG